MRYYATTMLAATLTMTVGAWAAAADLPDDIREAVEARRGQTELSKLADSMEPGTWAELETRMPLRLWTSPAPSRGLHIAGWATAAFWDSRTGQCFYMGLRQTRQFVAYSEEANAWRIVEFVGELYAPHLESRFGHIYGNNAFDAEKSRFYHSYGGSKLSGERQEPGTSCYDIRSEQWTRIPALNVGTGFIEYFSARRGMVALSSDAGLRFYDERMQGIEELGTIDVHGHHSMGRHNPFREEVLMVGGNESRRVVMRMKKDGTVERLKNKPMDLRLSSDKLTVDPISGRYLMLQWSERKLWEFDSDTNEYRLVDDFSQTRFPFDRFRMPVVAVIPEYGVTLWADREVHLYKHAAER